MRGHQTALRVVTATGLCFGLKMAKKIVTIKSRALDVEIKAIKEALIKKNVVTKKDIDDEKVKK